MYYIVTGSTSGLGFNLTSRLLLTSHVIGVSRSTNPPVSLQNHSRYHHLSFDLSNISNSSYEELTSCIFNIVADHPFTLIFNAASFYSSNIRMSISDLFRLYQIKKTLVLSFAYG